MRRCGRAPARARPDRYGCAASPLASRSHVLTDPNHSNHSQPTGPATDRRAEPGAVGAGAGGAAVGGAAVDPIELARANWVAHGWGAAADGMALVTSIMRVQQVFLARIEAVLRPRGLTFARYELLRLLAFTRRGVLPVGKIGERLQVHPASVTNAVQRLENDGHVCRSPNPSDGRSVLAELTPIGRALVEECTDLLNREVFSVVPIGDDEQQRVFAALRSLRGEFGDFD